MASTTQTMAEIDALRADLVNLSTVVHHMEGQQQDILDRISILNPRVKVLKSCQSKIDVMEILNTRLYSREDLKENSVIISAMNVKPEEKPKQPIFRGESWQKIFF